MWKPLNLFRQFRRMVAELIEENVNDNNVFFKIADHDTVSNTI